MSGPGTNYSSIGSSAGPFPVKVFTAGREVIASGSAITGNTSNLEVQIAQFKFVFNFLNDGTGHKVAYRSDGPSALVLDIYNFVEPLPTGTTEPVKLGSLAGKQLYISFFVSSLNSTSSKLVNYTFSLGEAIA
ncbi:DUF6864 domain-containing function [Burkholderia gladioli]|uniref:DUF6864 domain-containing function n=1 Tax=Burkholderia gladioli TaxID=28095 RepID=UPI00163E2D09|nr:hypothetical protein [Burkholderia gladioli]MDA0570753.1 hypothetical protein [Burkholderia gladioli]MDA0598739.1 hypothetical protein [Burkholderia gladioli]